MSEFRAIGKDEKPSIADVPIYRGTDDVVSDLQAQLATQQAAIDRLTAQLALAVEALRLIEDHHTRPGWDKPSNDPVVQHNRVMKLVAKTAYPTDPDIDAAVQAMQAGRRVLDREWLKGMLRDYAAKVYQQYNIEAIADAIIAKMKEAQ